MPEHSTVTSASATQDDAHYSPRLTNDDLAPVRQQTGAGTTFFFLDVGRAQHGRLCGGGQLLYAGPASWQVLICLLAGICIVQLCANGGEAEPADGRALRGDLPSGVRRFGANIPAVIRGLIAFARYGIQTARL